MNLLDRIIEARRTSNKKYDDFLDYLLIKDNQIIQLTNEQIKDNILTMIIAGLFLI